MQCSIFILSEVESSQPKSTTSFSQASGMTFFNIASRLQRAMLPSLICLPMQLSICFLSKAESFQPGILLFQKLLRASTPRHKRPAEHSLPFCRQSQSSRPIQMQMLRAVGSQSSGPQSVTSSSLQSVSYMYARGVPREGKRLCEPSTFLRAVCPNHGLFVTIIPRLLPGSARVLEGLRLGVRFRSRSRSRSHSPILAAVCCLT
jgi:hypothetical protein